MTISKDYEKYLSHFSKTVTLDEFHRNSLVPGLCALRHDVDHDLDLALEMAHFEHARGFSSTYFILPGTNYWRNDTRLIDKCLQLQDYGHEVGLHVNSLAEWVSGETNDISASLREQLATLRDTGLRIHGIAAHGDKRCYEHQLSNYWCFQELRPSLPYDHENGRTAEGPYETDGTPRLRYPKNHIATRADGTTLELWSTSMQSLDLRYHAWHTAFDQYFSDSTGGWKRTPDPLTVSRSNSRWQVLIHPEHWRGAKRYYFFLSSARSGSKWLSELLDTATPLHTRHEYVLNQPFHRGETSRKATTDVWALEDNREEVTDRLTEAWEEAENQPHDFAEVNVYLEGFASQLQRVFPTAVFIHLKREPALVVSSLMDRNWYDTPEDRRHPRLHGVDSKSIGQFERVCHYVAQVDKRLTKICTHRINLDELTKSPESLASELKKLGIAYHPRLGHSNVGRVSNARKEKNFPDPVDWKQSHKDYLQKILNGNQNLVNVSSEKQIRALSAQVNDIFKIICNFFNNLTGRIELSDLSRNRCIYSKFCNLTPLYGGKSFRVDFNNNNKERNAYFSLGGSKWQKTSKSPSKNAGWQTVDGKYVGGSISMSISNLTNIVIYAISYSESGKQLFKRNLGVLDNQNQYLQFAFTLHPQAKTFDLIAYVPKNKNDGSFTLNSWQLEFRE
jgi:hypothetical protein